MIFYNFLLLLSFICGECVYLRSCTDTVEGATWNFQPGIDVEIPYVHTVEECKQRCESDPTNCHGFTYTTNGVVGYCYKFKELTSMHECSTCSSGITSTGQEFEFMEGSCPFYTEDQLAELYSETAELCMEKCLDTSGCNSFTWYDSKSPSPYVCFLFSNCESVEDCTGCVTGRKTKCIKTPQCFDYNILDEDTRNEHSPGAEGYYKTDILADRNQSPRWAGPGYYRMLPPAGKIIPEEPNIPNWNHCGTMSPGFLRPGSHPDEVGVEVETQVWFSGISDINEITITKCPGDYFVYFLPDTNGNNIHRYCASLG